MWTPLFVKAPGQTTGDHSRPTRSIGRRAPDDRPLPRCRHPVEAGRPVAAGSATSRWVGDGPEPLRRGSTPAGHTADVRRRDGIRSGPAVVGLGVGVVGRSANPLVPHRGVRCARRATDGSARREGSEADCRDRLRTGGLPARARRRLASGVDVRQRSGASHRADGWRSASTEPSRGWRTESGSCSSHHFAAVLVPEAFTNGDNDVRAFAVRGTPASPTLVSIR